MRKDRKHNELREVIIKTDFMENALGSCLIEHGNTKVICSVSMDNNVPRWLKGSGKGWITAEYAMLPTSTHTRSERESTRGKLSGRTQEIQRLIGRSLRNVCNLDILNEKLLKVDCDVLSADGGTRTASINGAWVALKLATSRLIKDKSLKYQPVISGLTAVSCGILNNKVLIDLNYEEDSNAEADANFVFNSKKEIVEIQCTGEKKSISESLFFEMYKNSKEAVTKIFEVQKNALSLHEKK